MAMFYGHVVVARVSHYYYKTLKGGHCILEGGVLVQKLFQCDNMINSRARLYFQCTIINAGNPFITTRNTQ